MKLLLIGSAALVFVGVSAFAFPITAILNQAQQIQQAGFTPVAVFDLDETLIHSALRKTLSYEQALQQNEATLTQTWPQEVQQAESYWAAWGETAIRSLNNQYDSTALFQKMGIVNPAFVAAVDNLMLPIYLSNQYIPDDTAYEGAVQLLEGIYRAGGVVYFVTSRFQATQAAQTQLNLIKLHLFLNATNSILIMRDTAETSIDFKVRAYQTINSALTASEKVFIAAENEPENLNAMSVAFPSAQLVFVEGAILNQTVALSDTAHPLETRDFVK